MRTNLVQSAKALLASGATDTALRALIWLAVIQRSDGSFPQNSWVDGSAFWPGLQLDEVAAPILLAWRVRRAGIASKCRDQIRYEPVAWQRF